MSPENAQILLEVAQWTPSHQNRRNTLRQLAGTEENSLLLVRELEREISQCARARTLHAKATLPLVEWLETVNSFHRCCASCQSKPVQVMSHVLPLPQGGTTLANGVPACYSCRRKHARNDQDVGAYLASIMRAKQSTTNDLHEGGGYVPLCRIVFQHTFWPVLSGMGSCSRHILPCLTAHWCCIHWGSFAFAGLYASSHLSKDPIRCQMFVSWCDTHV